MSLIKDTVDDLKSNRPAFKSPIQMLVASNKKSVVFPINELEKPTIDSVLNTVPLFYNPITKQLLLQQDLEHSAKPLNGVHRKCDARPDHQSLNAKSRPLDARLEPTDKVRKLNNLNELNNRNTRLSNGASEPARREERKELLETQLDDFTTKTIVLDGKQTANNLSQRPVEIKLFDAKRSNAGSLINQNKAVNHCKTVTSSSSNITTTTIATNTSPSNRELNLDKLNLSDKAVESNLTSSSSPGKPDAGQPEEVEANKPPVKKKDTFKTHRRTPSYIHNFHDVIKSNNQSHQTKSASSITVSSVSNAIQNLTKTSLANATSTLSNTISTTNAKLNANQMNHSAPANHHPNNQLNNQLNSHLNNQLNHLNNHQPANGRTAKQIVFNESRNELNFYDLDTESETGSVLLNKSYSMDDDVEPLNLPSPYPEKPKKLSLITSPLQSVLSRLTKSSSSTSTTSKPESNANEKRRSSKSFDGDTPPSSTTGLIFENRPFNLPNKSPDEELSHRIQYEQLMKDVKRREQKDAKQLKKSLIKKKKEEERMLTAIRIWQNEVMPRFEELRHTKKVRELWGAGLPSNLRGSIWRLAIGNQLNLNEQSFESHLAKWYHSSLDSLQKDEDKLKDNDRVVNCLSKCSDESVYELIKLDVSRTFPSLKLFQKDAPFHDTLLKLLGTWAYYRPDIGYIQGMSFILGMFLLNMDSKLAFNAFANLLSSSPLLMTFMRVDQRGMESFYQTFDVYFSLNLPDLYNHFKQQKLNSELFMIDWIYTLFTKVLPLDISTRVWDLIFRDGVEQTVIRCSLAILKLYEKQLYLLNDFINCAQLLTQLSTQSANFPVDGDKFLSMLNGFSLKPVAIDKKTKCKLNYLSLYQHFNSNSTRIGLS